MTKTGIAIISGYIHFPDPSAIAKMMFKKLVGYLLAITPACYPQSQLDIAGVPILTRNPSQFVQQLKDDFWRIKTDDLNSHERKMRLTPNHENVYRTRNSRIFIVKSSYKPAEPITPDIIQSVDPVVLQDILSAMPAEDQKALLKAISILNEYWEPATDVTFNSEEDSADIRITTGRRSFPLSLEQLSSGHPIYIPGILQAPKHDDNSEDQKKNTAGSQEDDSNSENDVVEINVTKPPENTGPVIKVALQSLKIKDKSIIADISWHQAMQCQMVNEQKNIQNYLSLIRWFQNRAKEREESARRNARKYTNRVRSIPDPENSEGYRVMAATYQVISALFEIYAELNKSVRNLLQGL